MTGKFRMTNHLLENLTEPQRRAVTHIDGPMLVLAGPGSGKTRVITHRVAHLIQNDVPPQNILAITFTNKAAQEMRNRLQRMDIPHGSTLATFHALAARLLREFAQQANLKNNFSIYDKADQLSAMRHAIKNCQLDTQQFSPAVMLANVSNLKNDLVTPQQYTEEEPGAPARIYTAYQNHLRQNNALDFDDLLVNVTFLLRELTDLRDHLNNRYRYVLVDEYQDTNQCQYQMARGLSLNHTNLFVTGDPDQSIYTWRGADIQNILSFEKDNVGAKVVRLEENFRSTPEILFIADQVIKRNQNRKHKDLFTKRPSGPQPELIEHRSELDEAQWLVQWIKSNRDHNMEYREMAVFYRTNAMSRILEEALRVNSVPYQIVRGVEFYQRKEIKDVIAYLRLIVNPDDQVSLLRVINTPIRGIGNVTIRKLLNHCVQNSLNLDAALRNIDLIDTLNAATKTKLNKFAQLLEQLRSGSDQPVSQIIQKLYEQTGLKQSLADESQEEQADNVEELINGAALYDQNTLDGSLAHFLEQVALVSDTDNYDNNLGAVSLMTLHCAKGLEFPCVLIIGLEQGLIPHIPRHIEIQELPADRIEEERRLLFVGMTRAQQRLTLSYARNRSVQGITLGRVRSDFLRHLEGLDEQPLDIDPFETVSDGQNHTVPDPYLDSEPGVPLYLNQLIRHPHFGMGRVQEIISSGSSPKVIIKFNTGEMKTLILEYANLEIID